MGSVGQYTVCYAPLVGAKTSTGFTSRDNLTTELFMGILDQPTPAVNDEFSTDHWLDSVTWKFPYVRDTNTDAGILTTKLNGVSIGTVDDYSPSLTRNVYTEITGINVSTPGVNTIQRIMASKNASSTNYQGRIISVGQIRTGGVPSTPGGTDTPGYTWEWIPWMGAKGNTTWASRSQNSGHIGGGSHESTGAQNSEVDTDVWLDTGTFKWAVINYKASDAGIASLQIDGVEKATVDQYIAVATFNNYSEPTTTMTVSTAGVKDVKTVMSTKNASASNYTGRWNSMKIIRTGA